jgi:hypothetical protein
MSSPLGKPFFATEAAATSSSLRLFGQVRAIAG